MEYKTKKYIKIFFIIVALIFYSLFFQFRVFSDDEPLIGVEKIENLSVTYTTFLDEVDHRLFNITFNGSDEIPKGRLVFLDNTPCRIHTDCTEEELKYWVRESMFYCEFGSHGQCGVTPSDYYGWHFILLENFGELNYYGVYVNSTQTEISLFYPF